MLQKFLLIGVGGSGGKTLRYVWRELDRHLDAAGWTEGMPAGWQFLHIDVPEKADVIEDDVPPDADVRYLGLASAPQTYGFYDRNLSSRREALEGLAGWRPDPDRGDYKPPYLGAGQRRVVGRIVTLTQLDRVKESVQHRIRDMGTDEATAQLQRLGRTLRIDENSSRANTQVALLVSSLGGGSGSGAFLDVIHTLRSNASEGAQWVDRTLMTVLYAADVFADIKPEWRAGVEPNTLAAMAEVLNAQAHEGPVPQSEEDLANLGGGNAQIEGTRLGRHNYIIGAKNPNVTLESGRQVYRSVGKTIATLMVNDQVQHQFDAYMTNVYAVPCRDDFHLAESGSFSSFGHATVTLGRSLFADYATERVARRSLDRLLRGFREGVEAAHLRTDEALIADEVDRTKSTYFELTGLWELGADKNQVLDALRDKNEVVGALKSVVDDVQSQLQGNRRLSPQAWKDSVTAAFRARARDFDAEMAQRLDERAQQWTKDVQVSVLEATSTFAGIRGLDVAVGLVVALNEQVLDAASELRREKTQRDENAKALVTGFATLFNNIRDKVIGSTHTGVASAVTQQRNAVQQRFEGTVCILAAELLEEISGGLLDPLQRALRAAREELALGEVSSEYDDLVNNWATYEVPAHLTAAPNEVLLEAQDGFPGKLDELFDALVEGAGREAGEARAVQEIVSGAWPSRFQDAAEKTPQTLITTDSTWIPGNDRARDINDVPRNASYRIDLNPAALERLASTWVRHRRGPLADYTAETLAEWLESGAKGAAGRADAFVDAVGRALARSGPLVSVNPDAHAAVHGALPGDDNIIVSEIPIGTSHRAAKRVLKHLETAGLDQAAAQQLLQENSKVREISMTSLGGRYVHPIVFDSLTGPINDQWKKCASQSQRNDFWAFRRSRTLTSFVPLSPSRQRSLVRGWLVADALGYVERLADAWSQSPLDIWTPTGHRTFPRWLLGPDIAEAGEVLPALLESLPLAIASYSGGDNDSLQAYFRLIELGSSSAASIPDASSANLELVHWVRTGTPYAAEPKFPAAPTPRAGNAEQTPQERANELLEVIGAYAEGYRKTIASKRVTAETTLTVGRSWEVHHLVGSAALELINAVQAIDVSPDGPDQGPVIPLPR